MFLNKLENLSKKKKFRLNLSSSVGAYIDATLQGVPLYFTVGTVHKQDDAD